MVSVFKGYSRVSRIHMKHFYPVISGYEFCVCSNAANWLWFSSFFAVGDDRCVLSEGGDLCIAANPPPPNTIAQSLNTPAQKPEDQMIFCPV